MTRYRKAQVQINNADLFNPEGWSIKSMEWDVLEGKTLYSWSGPEMSTPEGLEMTVEMEKVVSGVPIKAEVEFKMMVLDVDDGFVSFDSTVNITKLSPPDADVVDEDGVVLWSLREAMGDFIAENVDPEEVEPEAVDYLKQELGIFGRTQSKMRGRWHTYY